MGYRFERISQHNFNSFIEVIQTSFGTPADAISIRNKFNTDWCDISFIGFLAFEEATSEPAAFYGVYPALAQYQGEKILIAQSGDTATTPKNRRKGLFKQLHDKTIDLCVSKGIKLIFGFPNQNSYPGFMKFGWSHEQNAQTYHTDFKLSFSKRLLKKIFPKHFHRQQLEVLEDLSVADDQRSNLIPSLADTHSLHIPRTKEYLKYKNDLGARSIQLLNGQAVIAIRDNQMTIGEIFGNNPAGLIDEAISLCNTCGLERLLVSSNSKIHRSILSNKLLQGPKIPIITKVIDHSLNGVDFSCSSIDFDTF